MTKYKGPERRARKSRALDIRGMAMRVVRDGVHIDELETREDDPRGLVEQTREYVRGLVTRSSTKTTPEAIWEVGLPEVTQETPWLLPESDARTKAEFMEYFDTMKGKIRKCLTLILARYGIGVKVAQGQLSEELRQMIPNQNNILGSLMNMVSFSPEYLRGFPFSVVRHGNRDATYSLECTR